MSSLSQLDNYLKAQKPRQRYVLYFVTVVLIFALGYILLLSDLETELEDASARANAKRTELAKLKKNSGIKHIKILNKEIKQIKDNIGKSEDSPQQGDVTYAGKAPNLNITDGEFAKFLEASMGYSKKLNINLSSVKINSQKLPYIGFLEINKYLILIGNGRFLDVLTLIRYMEKQRFLIKLKSLEIDKPKPPSKDDKNRKKYKRKNVNFVVLFEVLGASII